MKTTALKIAKYLITILLITLLQVGLLVSIALIPRSAIQANMEKSADILSERTVFFHLNDRDLSSNIDRYADSILLNIAYYYDNTRPFASILRGSYYYTDTANENHNLQTAVTTQPAPTYDYMRYWHGSNVIVRPLLTVLDIREIYILNAILFVLLFVLTLCFIKKYMNGGICICFTIAMIMVSPWYVPFSLEYVWTMLLMLVASLILLFLRNQDDFILTLFFMITGSFTAYFDFLTTETLTLLVPLILLLCYKAQKQQLTQVKCGIRYAFCNAVFWLAGYASAWILKWTLSSVVLRQNAFLAALSQAEYRFHGETGEAFGIKEALASVLLNMKCLFPFCYFENAGLFVCIMAFLIVLSLYYITRQRNGCPVSTLFLLIGTVPYFRFLLLANHSYLHYFFTYRAQLSTIFALSLAVFYGTDWEYLSKKRQARKKIHGKKTQNGRRK